MRCRNRACLLNEELKCGSPCRNMDKFTCKNKDVVKDPVKQIDYSKTSYLYDDFFRGNNNGNDR